MAFFSCRVHISVIGAVKHVQTNLDKTVWLIWKKRNGFIFEGIDWRAEHISKYAASFLQEFQTYQDKQVEKVKVQQRWNAPADDYLKMNVDGAYTKDGAGVGVVVRNSKGEVEAVMIENIPQSFDAEHVETLAFLKAMQFARDFGMTHFVIEGDALGVVQKLNSRQEELSMYGHFHAGIRQMTVMFQSVKFVCVSRQCNTAAHEAAKLAVKARGNLVWFVNFPHSVMYAAKLDIAN